MSSLKTYIRPKEFELHLHRTNEIEVSSKTLFYLNNYLRDKVMRMKEKEIHRLNPSKFNEIFEMQQELYNTLVNRGYVRKPGLKVTKRWN